MNTTATANVTLMPIQCGTCQRKSSPDLVFDLLNQVSYERCPFCGQPFERKES